MNECIANCNNFGSLTCEVGNMRVQTLIVVFNTFMVVTVSSMPLIEIEDAHRDHNDIMEDGEDFSSKFHGMVFDYLL